MQACWACAAKLGIIPIPEPRRPRVPCRHCNGMKFLHAIPREHSTERGGDANKTLSAPMFLTHAATHTTSFWKGQPDGASEIAIESGHGMLEVYVCLGCGLVEWYCHDVASIPVHPHLMTEVIDYDSDTPYR